MTKVDIKSWGQAERSHIFLYTLKNSNGMQMNVTNYGAIVQSLVVPTSNGDLVDVVLGYDSLEEYVRDPYYIGAIVGRYAGRIANGRIEVKGVPYQLTINGNGFHHHGGQQGFNKKTWAATPVSDNGVAGLRLVYHSSDHEEGYPGNLEVTVTYTLTDDNEWKTEIVATTDHPTVLNLTQHSYFNLAGYAIVPGTILDHLLTVHSSLFVPVNANVLPTGEFAPVAHTPFDFQQATTIGARVHEDHQQLRYGGGYDHSYVLKNENSSNLLLAASVEAPAKDLHMKVFTTEPSVHLYTGNFLGDGKGKRGVPFQKHAALCLETQHLSDSPNQPQFPTTLLEPGDEFRSQTVFQFVGPGKNVPKKN